WRNPPCNLLDCVEIDIASEASAGKTPEAHVNHTSARLHHLGGDQVIPTRRYGSSAGHENVSATADCTQVARMSMAAGDGGIAQITAENQRERLASDVAAANYHHFGTVYRNLVIVQQS